MSYQLYDNDSSIKIFLEPGGGELTLLKSFIKEITIVREDVIKLGRECCSCSMYIRHHDVTYPVTASAIALISFISQWITNQEPTPPIE